MSERDIHTAILCITYLVLFFRIIGLTISALLTDGSENIELTKTCLILWNSVY